MALFITENMHLSLGYNKYHSYLDMGIDDNYLDLDSYIIRDGYNQIVQLNDKIYEFYYNLFATFTIYL